MGPASMFASAARRSARCAFSSLRAAAAAPRPGSAPTRDAAASFSSVLASSSTSSFAAHRGTTLLPIPRHRARRLTLAAAAEANVSDIDIGEDANPKLPPAVSSLVDGSLVVLEGVGGDVAPGTIVHLGADGAKAVLLSHREPK